MQHRTLSHAGRPDQRAAGVSEDQMLQPRHIVLASTQEWSVRLMVMIHAWPTCASHPSRDGLRHKILGVDRRFQLTWETIGSQLRPQGAPFVLAEILESVLHSRFLFGCPGIGDQNHTIALRLPGINATSGFEFGALQAGEPRLLNRQRSHPGTIGVQYVSRLEHRHIADGGRRVCWPVPGSYWARGRVRQKNSRPRRGCMLTRHSTAVLSGR